LVQKPIESETVATLHRERGRTRAFDELESPEKGKGVVPDE